MVTVTLGILLAVSTWLTAALRPDCHMKPQHTLCLLPNPACQHISRGVDAAARARILELHNDYRSLVAKGQLQGFPPAADMQELLWDEELAEVAQAHAELCKHADVSRGGTKLAGSASSAISPVDWDDSVKMWFNEYTDYPANRVASYDQSGISNAIGHFTQVIWAKSRYVGCGYLQYYVPNSIYKDVKLYTCNYGPAGNSLGLPVYQEGLTCGACPQPTTCNESSGLCFDDQSSRRDIRPCSIDVENRGDGDAGGGEEHDDEEAVGENASTSSLWYWLPLLVGIIVGVAVCTAGMVWISRRYAATEHVAAPQPGDQTAATNESQMSTQQ
ncbi:venom allergen 5-like [Haemaphysalis longicornis]